MNERSPLFLVKPDVGLVRMMPSAPQTEDELQELIAKYPALIGDGDGELLLIQREQGIPDDAEAADRWSIDHLFVTRNAVPVLVEVKRAVDTRLRREVVGQILDYAANGIAFWPLGTIARQFEEGCTRRAENPETKLASFLGGRQQAAEFWAQVDANLRSGRVKLLIVADEIPSELARIVEFLNEQMTADVWAIELRYFQSPDGIRTLVPRIIGETERGRAQKSGARPKLEPITDEEWIAKHIEPLGAKVAAGADALLAIMRESKAEVGVSSAQGSIYMQIPILDGKSTFPLYLVKNGTAQIGFGSVLTSPMLAAEEVRRGYYDRFAATVGPLSSKNLKGYPSFPLERLSDPTRAATFGAVADDFFRACRAEQARPDESAQAARDSA
jgi:hypothetical protein